ncbi:MAG TPA: hypothetical protein VFV95_06735 [Vicinamibacterales bacterium]|nr:hypothetical protein [Vicinamibacterales bacterium]
MSYRFVVAEDTRLTDDYLVFVHVYDEKGESLWNDDHEPAVPTREWKPGAVIEYSRPLLVPRRTLTGTVSIELGLYSPRTGDRLPLTGQPRGRRSYSVGTIDVQGGGEPPAMFIEDFYPTERPDESGTEWHWTTARATIWCPNPMRAATFALLLDQPVPLPQPQHVEIHAGGRMVDTFALPTGQRALRRIPLPASALGSDEVARITIVVDRTFVPASLPQLGTPDTRELGVRVLHASLEPQ